MAVVFCLLCWIGSTTTSTKLKKKKKKSAFGSVLFILCFVYNSFLSGFFLFFIVAVVVVVDFCRAFLLCRRFLAASLCRFAIRKQQQKGFFIVFRSFLFFFFFASFLFFYFSWTREFIVREWLKIVRTHPLKMHNRMTAWLNSIDDFNTINNKHKQNAGAAQPFNILIQKH